MGELTNRADAGRTTYLYRETSRRPYAKDVYLTEKVLSVGDEVLMLSELNLVAMGEAYARGMWLGGGGVERPVADIGSGHEVVPVIQATGSSVPLKPRRAAEFAAALGALAVRHSGGEEELRQHAARAEAEDVPLWIARQSGSGVTGPVTLAVDQGTPRVDAWSEDDHAARLRAPHGMSGNRKDAGSLRLTVGGQDAQLAVDTDRADSRPSVTVQLPGGQGWELQQDGERGARLVRDGQTVAQLTRPGDPAARDRAKLAPTFVDCTNGDQRDAVLAHVLAAAFELGADTGTLRLDSRQRKSGAGDVETWQRPWNTGLALASEEAGRSGVDSDPLSPLMTGRRSTEVIITSALAMAVVDANGAQAGSGMDGGGFGGGGEG